jgi:hypothetical protein
MQWRPFSLAIDRIVATGRHLRIDQLYAASHLIWEAYS